MAFKKKVIALGAIEKCAAYAAREHGDARRALELLRVAAEIAERSNANNVAIKHIDDAEEKIERDRILDIINIQPKQFQLTLYSILSLYLKRKSILFTGEIYELYKELAKKNNIGNILFLGFIPNSKLADYLNACDILMMPYQKQLYSASGKKRNSSQWMSPLKMFEYMASGNPIISSDIPVLKEVLENEVNSLLVQPDSLDEWISTINRIKNDNNLGRKLARNARSRAESYSWTKRAKNILDQQV